MFLVKRIQPKWPHRSSLPKRGIFAPTTIGSVAHNSKRSPFSTVMPKSCLLRHSLGRDDVLCSVRARSDLSTQSYKKAQTSLPLPKCMEEPMLEWLEHYQTSRDDPSDPSEYTASLLHELQVDFGVKVDDKKRIWWVIDGFYTQRDHQEFVKDKESPPVPEWWLEESDIENYILKYARALLCESRSICCLLQQSSYLRDELENKYGLELNEEMRSWQVIERFKPLLLSFSALRQRLAPAIEMSLTGKGFTRLSGENARSQEEQAGCKIFSRPMENDFVRPEVGCVTLRVRSSIERDKDEVTERNGHPIHIYSEYTQQESNWNSEQLLKKSTIIRRVGEVSGVVKRMEERIEEVEAMMKKDLNLCPDCEVAPLFKSRKGNWVCCHFCWARNDMERRRFREDGSEKLLQDALKAQKDET